VGVFYETIRIRKAPSASEPIELTMEVDPGATMLVLSGWV